MPLKPLGLYIHVPFCAHGKCPYCDFYSMPYDNDAVRDYIGAVHSAIDKWARKAGSRPVDTVYFGGGTPLLLGGALAELLSHLKSAFQILGNAEITFEANPEGVALQALTLIRQAGANRLSLGMQSAHQCELTALGRRHTPQDIAAAALMARRAGLSNISLDLMLATPGQSPRSLTQSIEFASSLNVTHISAYLLKIEPGTEFYSVKDRLKLPDDDTQSNFYLLACSELEKKGFIQYEISNFAKKGFESHHNLRYWNCDEYIGIGPGAHSFFDGRRFFYDRDLHAFVSGAGVTDDGEGGGLEEYLMLRLRLNDGLNVGELMRRYGRSFDLFSKKKLERLAEAEYLIMDETSLRLTRKGFLMSNAVISELMADF